MRIARRDLRLYGRTPGCWRCIGIGKKIGNTNKGHSEECRLRFDTEWQEAEAPKYNLIKQMLEPDTELATMNLAALISMTDIANELNHHN